MAGRRGGKKRKTPPRSRSRSPSKKGRQQSTLAPSESDVEHMSNNSFSDSNCLSTNSQASKSTRKTTNSDSNTKPNHSPNTSSQPQSKPKVKIPPIILTSTQWRKAAPLFYSNPANRPDQINAKASSDGNVHVTTTDEYQFRALQKCLVDQTIEFHTFKLPEERTLKVVIKGIFRDITEDEVKTELENRNFKVQLVRRFGSADRPLPICMVILNQTETAKNIFNITNLFYVQITVESYKKSGPSQCHSCQRFGHGSSNCGHPPGCVKCAGNHHTRDCTKTLIKEPTCCNCGEAHTANYSKCPFFLHVTSIETKNPRQQVISRPVPVPVSAQPQPITSIFKQSYANATKIKTGIQVEQILTLLLDLLKALTTFEDPKTMMLTTINTFIQIISTQHG